MFVRYFVQIDHPVDLVTSALGQAPRSSLAESARQANQDGEAVILKLGLGIDDELPGAFIQVLFGELARSADSALLPMSWWAFGCRKAIIESELEISAVGQFRTQLAINARYSPPGSLVESVTEGSVLQRAAELAIKRFLDRTAAILEGIMAASVSMSPGKSLALGA